MSFRQYFYVISTERSEWRNLAERNHTEGDKQLRICVSKAPRNFTVNSLTFNFDCCIMC